MHIPLPSPTFNDIAWTSQLDDAIQNNDLTHMWQLVQLHVDRDEGHRQLVTRIPRMVHQIHRRTYFSELFLMPVLIWGGNDVFESSPDWKQVYACVDEMLVSWLPAQTFTMIFYGLRSYDHLGAWQPTIIRQHLQRAMAAHSVNKIRYAVEPIELPPMVPRLGFATMVLTSKLGWPSLPEARPVMDLRLRQVIAFALHNTPGSETPIPIVLPPDRFQYAVTSGLILWLEQLHQACPIQGWSASPHPKSVDVVVITLHLGTESSLTQFAVRNHHVGLQGLRNILMQLQALAPNLEQAMDA